MADEQKEKRTRNLDTEILTNRQINYTIFKMLWHLREDKSSMQEFYSQMGINRNRYRSIVTNDSARTPRLQEVANKLSKVSGIPAEVYIGKTAFIIDGISLKDWEDYFKEIETVIVSDKKGAKEYAQEQCAEFENKLMLLLKTVPVTRDVDVNLYSAYSYFVYGEMVNSSEIQVRLKRLVNQMRGITFAQLESLDSAELEEYSNQLKEHLEMIETLSSYRKFKNL